ncbi:hypothetical protein GCM10011519_32900 [Marmoricola endophyticus]|uniref:Coenzyme F420:L-glutamate ligase-like domain-containing protein n=1 Tax=Marmoricola endophyticus TaxID=2040280 RepID=A0A917BRV3_9ACTN|nr:coenzyme F420-0:L-glutamate ligase [Marmoricola endophyticus]GGF56362.1 hypothetical protein GCM10011519_32900 [Marmoricola endophyticus]
MSAVPGRIEVLAPDGVGEVLVGTDLVALVVAALPDLADGDVVVLTSKIVSKAEGRTVAGTRDEALPGQTVRLVARRGPTSIVANPQGLVMAAAGIDASNVETGHVLLLPEDPDASARAVREGVRERTGRNVAVLVTDTAGRAWRHGQSDLAIGAAGIEVLDDHAGRVDAHGNELAVTAPALVDELAGAADLVKGKLTGRPVAVVRGLAALVLPDGDHGPGARSLTRDLSGDMFALGAREAVVAALAGEQPDAFGAPAPAGDVVDALRRLGVRATGTEDVVRLERAGDDTPLAALGHALGWTPDGGDPLEWRPGRRPATG